MSTEGAPESASYSPIDTVLSLIGSQKVAREAREKFTEFFANTPLADSIARTSFAKSIRLGVTILAAAVGGSSTQSLDAAKYLDAAKQVRSLMYEAGVKQAQMMQENLARPSFEQHQTVLAQATYLLTGLRTQTKHQPGSAERVAFDVVLANILDPRTSMVLREMWKNNHEKGVAEEWLQREGVQADFSSPSTLSVMQNEPERTRFIDAMHELYDTPEIRELQALLGDSRLLYNYECIFRAINQPEYRATHEVRIRRAAEELLKEGNLEKVVETLRGSGAAVPAEKIVGIISQYVPDSVFASTSGKNEPLTPGTDPGLARLGV